MAYTQAQFESDVQTLIDDLGYPYEESRNTEDLTNQVVGGNGNRLTFNLSHTNINASGALVNINNAGFTPTGFSINDVQGILIFASGMQPTLSAAYPYPTQLECMYYFQHFQLSDIDTFINYGLGKVDCFPMTGANATLAYQNLSPGFYQCVLWYAASQAYYRLSSKYARIPNVSAEGKSASKSVISIRYSDLGKEYQDAAEKERLALNGPRQGQSTVGSLNITHNINPNIRWRNGRISY